MKHCLLRNSLFLFLILLVKVGFSQTTIKSVPIPNFNSVKYRASIDVMNKHLSGILIFKTQEDNSVRVVFINEMGTSFFDVSFTQTNYTFHSTMKSFDKKSVKRTLAKDLGMILMRGIYKSNQTQVFSETYFEKKLIRKGTVRYYPSLNNLYIDSMANFGKRKKVISIYQNYLSSDNIPEHIFVQHHTFNFSINLSRLHVTE